MKFLLGLCQMQVGLDKAANVDKAEAMIREAVRRGAQVVSLPEIFNCPYSNKYFRDYAEEAGGPTYRRLQALAKELSIVLVGGSIPEWEPAAADTAGQAAATTGEAAADNMADQAAAGTAPQKAAADHAAGRVYNTSFAFGPDGALLARHRKVHLFDVDVENGISIRESDTISPGDQCTTFDTPYGRFGLAICYDVRFPEIFRSMALAGAKLVILPAAFSYATGMAHWEITLRTRALDNQVFVAAVSPSRDPESPYLAYGHSCVTTPWGDFAGRLDHREGILVGEVDLDYVETVKKQLPLLAHRKPALYRAWEEQQTTFQVPCKGV